jgi:hypothetical protein
MSNKDNFDIKECAGNNNLRITPVIKENQDSFLSFLAKLAGEILLMPIRAAGAIYTGAIAGAFKVVDLTTSDYSKDGTLKHNASEGISDFFLGYTKEGVAAIFYAPKRVMDETYNAYYDFKHHKLTVLSRAPSSDVSQATAYQAFAPEQTQGPARAA